MPETVRYGRYVRHFLYFQSGLSNLINHISVSTISTISTISRIPFVSYIPSCEKKPQPRALSYADRSHGFFFGRGAEQSCCQAGYHRVRVSESTSDNLQYVNSQVTDSTQLSPFVQEMEEPFSPSVRLFFGVGNERLHLHQVRVAGRGISGATEAF